MSDTQLTVTLSGGGIDDARAIVRALEGVFGAPDGLPADEQATVRTATFDSPAAPEAASETLSRAFSTQNEGAASGDQERERELLLVP